MGQVVKKDVLFEKRLTADLLKNEVAQLRFENQALKEKVLGLDPTWAEIESLADSILEVSASSLALRAAEQIKRIASDHRAEN